jgi:hypothetical protein
MLSASLIALALVAASNALVTKRATCPDGVNSATNAACCAWFAVRDDLVENVFEGLCGENAHSTVRIAFHDAIGFSLSRNFGGGADGSIIQFQDTELNFAANAGISDIVTDLQPLAITHGISFGDVIQFGASVALSLCPGAPSVQTFVGRPNATQAAPDGTVPDPFDTVTSILARMADAGFAPAELVALLSSHSIAAQDEQDPTIHGSPFDSTPGSFDSQIFLEVMLRGTLFPGTGRNQGESESPMEGEFRLLSDQQLARDDRTSCTWQSFALSQATMASQFSAAMAKLALVGHSASSLTDCTEVIAKAPPATQKQAFFPAGQTHNDIEQACATALFPTTLITQAGSPTAIAVVPTQ